nr:hypothetical protein L203_00369 [Cryptococcus depauperatus CBS 7841]
MVALDITQVSKALSVTGGYVSLSGLVSYFVKEKLHMSEALIATLIGIATGPFALKWLNPNEWSEDPDYQTHQITRIIIAIQVLFTGVSLPRRYLREEWLSLTTLLGPIMTTAWFISSLLIWGLIPGLTFLESLVVGACVTPTDPVLSNSICRGRYAEKNVPLHVRNIILAESGANDGLGYPFLYIGLYLILIHEASHPWHTVGGAVGEWYYRFYNIVFYQIVLSCLIGTAMGYVARKALRYAKSNQLIDHESFLSISIALTFFTSGLVGLIGSDDILACFAVGNALNWDDWFRLETEKHGFHDIIDELLNSAVFLYIGAILPWDDYNRFGMTPWRLVALGISVMILRRLPFVVLLKRWIPSLCTFWESLFVGYFGPIGVGAVFYSQVALRVIPNNDTRFQLRHVIIPVVYFIVFTSIVIHGITIPLGKGLQKARTSTKTLLTSYTISAASVGEETDGANRLRRIDIKAGPVVLGDALDDGNAESTAEKGQGSMVQSSSGQHPQSTQGDRILADNVPTDLQTRCEGLTEHEEHTIFVDNDGSETRRIVAN